MFGLGSATILTLIVTPALLMGLANIAEWRASRRVRRAQRRAMRQARRSARVGGEAEPFPMPAD